MGIKRRPKIRIISQTLNQPEWLIRADGDPARLGAPGKGLADLRVLLAGMSNMLSSIVTAAIAQAPDIAVAGRVGGNEDLAAKLSLIPADSVVVQTDRPEAAESFMSLMRRFPALKVIAIDGEGNSGFLYQLRLHSIRLPELSADLLQSVLRTQISVVSETDWSAVLQLMQTENRSPP